MNIVNLLEKAVEAHASDIFIVAGLPISYRANGSIHHENEEKLMPPQTKKYLEEIYELAGNRDINILEEKGDDDFYDEESCQKGAQVLEERNYIVHIR